MKRDELIKQLQDSVTNISDDGLKRLMIFASSLESSEAYNINTPAERVSEIKAEIEADRKHTEEMRQEREKIMRQREDEHETRYSREGILSEIGKSKCYTLVAKGARYHDNFEEILKYISETNMYDNALDFFTFGCIVGAKETKARLKK